MTGPAVQVIWCTAPADAAPTLASALVEERLVACVNVLPGVTSTYRWEGQVETEQEVLLMMKTTAARRGALTTRLEELHPYDVPEILTMDLADGEAYEPYERWVRQQVESEDKE